jgi:DNA-binding CsgD family transcriptional regulator
MKRFDPELAGSVGLTVIEDGLVLISVAERRAVRRGERASQGLSAGESAVVALAARGRSNAEIARARNISPRTVANQLAASYRKLGVSGRRELRARLARARHDP